LTKQAEAKQAEEQQTRQQATFQPVKTAKSPKGMEECTPPERKPSGPRIVSFAVFLDGLVLPTARRWETAGHNPITQLRFQ
jgi:hypothetical protein